MKKFFAGMVVGFFIGLWLGAYIPSHADPKPKEPMAIYVGLPRLDLNVACADSMTADECKQFKKLQDDLESYVNVKLQAKWKELVDKVNVQASRAHEASR